MVHPWADVASTQINSLMLQNIRILSPPPPHMNTHTQHSHMHAHTHTHACVHTHTHKRMHFRARAHTHAHTHWRLKQTFHFPMDNSNSHNTYPIIDTTIFMKVSSMGTEGNFIGCSCTVANVQQMSQTDHI